MVGFVPRHSLVAAEGTAPRAWMLMLHGILGSGGNWRSVARALSRRDPAWGLVLVDLRMHGGSQDAPPPHTVASAADDLGRLARHLAEQGRAVRAVSGHSFGGKVALAYRLAAPPELLATFVLDATPSVRPAAARAVGVAGMAGGDRDPAVADIDGVIKVVDTLAEMPPRYARRDDFIAGMEARGFTSALSQWLAMNLVADGDGYRLAVDLVAIRALLADYFTRDLWSAVERDDLPGALHFVVGGKSTTVGAADRARLARLAPRVTTAVLPDAGHWLHLDPGLVDEMILPEV